MKFCLSSIFFCFLTPVISFAGADLPVQVRLFVGSTTIKPQQLNDELVTQGIDKIENATRYGMEANSRVNPYLSLGLNYTARKQDEKNPSNSAKDVSLVQESFSLIGRVPLIKRDFFIWDIFGGVGTGSTEVNLNAGAVSGSLKKDYYTSALTSYGTTLAVGYKKYFFYVEGGYESNKVGSLTRSGSINQSVKNVDLSGSYVNLGILIDGLPTSFGPSRASK